MTSVKGDHESPFYFLSDLKYRHYKFVIRKKEKRRTT